jgi:hypothetical protein
MLIIWRRKKLQIIILKRTIVYSISKMYSKTLDGKYFTNYFTGTYEDHGQEINYRISPIQGMD